MPDDQLELTIAEMLRRQQYREKKMSDLVARASGSSLAPTSRRASKELAKAVEHEGSKAVVRAARVEAAAYVAHVGLNYTGALTMEEVRLAEQCPERQYRYRHIVDAYAGLVASTIAQMGFER